MSVEIKDLKPAILELILEVGDFIGGEFNHFDTNQIEYKGTNDLVSYVDKKAEDLLVAGFKKLIPSSCFINEETGKIDGNSPYRWIIDPLDGTTNFTHGVPAFCISVALQKEEKTVLGVVFEVNKKELFYADKTGAFLNGEKIRVSGKQSLNDCLLATGFPFREFEILEKYTEILKYFMLNTHGLRRIGSAALDLAYTAVGRFDGFFEFNLSPWDIAAGSYIVQQAGGMVSDFAGQNQFLFGRQILAAPAPIHHEMLKVIKSKLT